MGKGRRVKPVRALMGRSVQRGEGRGDEREKLVWEVTLGQAMGSLGCWVRKSDPCKWES